jgi:hypothetical protein
VSVTVLSIFKRAHTRNANDDYDYRLCTTTNEAKNEGGKTITRPFTIFCNVFQLPNSVNDILPDFNMLQPYAKSLNSAKKSSSVSLEKCGAVLNRGDGIATGLV